LLPLEKTDPHRKKQSGNSLVLFIIPKKHRHLKKGNHGEFYLVLKSEKMSSGEKPDDFVVATNKQYSGLQVIS